MGTVPTSLDPTSLDFMILLLTGNGKGKTTSAIGQGLRAMGQGKRVIMFQFIKSKEWVTGEDRAIKGIQRIKRNQRTKRIKRDKIGTFELIKGGLGFVGIMGDKLPRAEHQKAAQNTLKQIKEASHSKKYDLIIMDEVNVAVSLKLISSAQVLEVLNSAPPEVDFVLTGRSAPKEFIDKADIVSEVKEIKHPFQKGTLARRSIEY